MALFNKILVPIDFSRHSELAMEYACALAQRFDASVLLMHALAMPVYPLPEGYVAAGPEVLADMMHKADTALQRLKSRALALGAPRADVVATEGPAFATIIGVARERGCDLIVMGTHGRTGLSHALIGSVAEKVVRKAPCAVLTVRDGEHTFVKP